MGFKARIVLDSVSPAGVRLTTAEVRLPRLVLSELNTHRSFSRNSASSRAVPVRKTLAAVWSDPFEPISFGRNQKGMSAREDLTGWRLVAARGLWHGARLAALAMAWGMNKVGLHKQVANRVLEPFSFHTVILTATDWSNFYAQRCHPDAQPEIRHAAELLRAAMEASTPTLLKAGQWHTPFIQADEYGTLDDEQRIRVSVARCARVSFLTQNGTRDVSEDLLLYDRLLNGGANGHWSPLEHQATPAADAEERSGNFRGWLQNRKRFPGECA